MSDLSITFRVDSWYYGEDKIPAGTTSVTIEGQTYRLVGKDASDGFTTIQAAVEASVDAAGDGDIIMVAPGIYEEQVAISGVTGLTIQAAGEGVTIKAPADLTQTDAAYWDYDITAVIAVSNSTDVTISGVTVDGADRASDKPAGTEFAGVLFSNSSGSLEKSTVTGIRPETLGVDVSRAVAVVNDTDHKDNLFTATGNTFTNFEKSAIVVRQAKVDITDNTITGEHNGVIAQNGLDLGENVTGTVSGNTITGIGFHPASENPDYSSGILAWGAGTALDIHSNTITGVDVNDNFGGILIQIEGPSAGSSVYGNIISTAQLGVYEYASANVGSVDTDGPTNDAPNQVTGVTNGYVLYTDPATEIGLDRTGTNGNDIMTGGAGADHIEAGAGADHIEAGAGVDTVAYGEGAEIAFVDGVWTVKVGDVVDTLKGVERVTIGDKTFVLVSEAADGGYCDLNAAIAGAADGDTILVAAGTYQETVVVNKDVTILGANAGVGGYDRLNPSAGEETVIAGGIQIVAEGVTLDGLNIRPGLFVGEQAGVFVQAANVTITNSFLAGEYDAGSRGIVTDASATGLTVSGNVFSGWATGAYFNSGTTGSVTGNVFATNYVGISMDDPAGLSVTGNVLFGNEFENIGVGVTTDSANIGQVIGANTILSTAPGGDVSIYGLGTGHNVQGTVYADTFYGSNEADTFAGGAGNDVINGGDGDDTASFSGNRSDYTVAYDAETETVTITDLRENGTGTDTVSGVETFSFANGSVSVEKLNVNEAPTEVTLNNQVITTAENGAAFKVADITITDDLLGSETLSLVGADAAAFELRGSALWFLGGANFEAKASYSIAVKATDAEAGSATSDPITVSVTDVNEAPTAISLNKELASLTTAENGDAMKVTDITVTDDALGNNTLSLVGDDADMFEIRGNALWFKGGANFEATSSYSVAVKVTEEDGGSITSDAITVTVTDENDNDPEVNVTVYDLDENATNVVVADLTSLDPDTIGLNPAQFSISGELAGVFEINEDNQLVYVGDPLDFEAIDEKEGEIQVSAFDGVNTTTTTVKIRIRDVNEAPTAVALSAKTVAENAASAVIGTLSTTDQDADETFAYTVSDSRFEVVDGQLKLKAGVSLNYETESKVDLTVTSKDAGGLSHQQEFTVDVMNVNEAPSKVALSGGSVLENSANGTTVGTLSALDPDAGDTFTYSLVNNADGRFTISGDQILVSDALRLDYEQATSHQVIVRATDRSGASHDEVLTISLADVLVENVLGTASIDRIVGSQGNDVIIGGAGRDTMTGGAGKDVFIFNDKDTGSNRKSADYITDFSGRAGDKIDLRAMDANTTKKGNQNFSFIGTDAFTNAGQVRYEKAGNYTYVYLNTDNDKAAEGVIKLKGVLDLQKSWFVL